MRAQNIACRRRGGDGERGAVAVETVLVLPILLLLVFGIIEFGFAFNAQISLTQATREGVRLGAVGDSPSTEAMESRLELAYMALTPAEPQVENAEACDPNSPTYLDDRAELTARLDFVAPISRFGPFTLRSTAVMRCGG